MFASMIIQLFSNMLYFVLHVTNAGSFPRPLSDKEESDLVDKMEAGDDNARKKLIEHNLRLVAHISKKYYNGQVDQDDLISIGTIGLIKAISTYNKGKGIKLATYSARCIENEILMYFRNIKKYSQDVFINDTIDTDKDGNSLTLLDVISDDINIIDDIDLKIKLENLERYMAQVLSEREKTVLILRYGLYNQAETTQRDVAKRLNISRSYVSRIEKKALSKLRHCFESC
ncbi:MAG: RNA polymerase sporulation sigma factor SigK [bacterium]|nr:RNA polymerase sporulation sigma factor SigK [bacterium]